MNVDECGCNPNRQKRKTRRENRAGLGVMVRLRRFRRLNDGAEQRIERLVERVLIWLIVQPEQATQVVRMCGQLGCG